MNEFASRVGASLFRAYPEWHEHKRENPKAPEEFFVEVPAPQGSRARSLQVFTEEGEVFIFVPGAPPEWPAETLGFDDFLILIAAILEDRVRFAIYSRDSEWVKSDLLEEDEKPEPPEPGVTVTVVSWSGRNDELEPTNA